MGDPNKIFRECQEALNQYIQAFKFFKDYPENIEDTGIVRSLAIGMSNKSIQKSFTQWEEDELKILEDRESNLDKQVEKISNEMKKIQ